MSEQTPRQQQAPSPSQQRRHDYHDEPSTNMSYYVLYQQINKSLPPHDGSDDSPWHVDEWTPQDTLEAETLLQEAQERCNIQQHAARQHIHKPQSKDWNTFYEQHTTNFFKDRHYLQQDFPLEMQTPGQTLVEIGCGVGNALLPLLKNGWTVWGLDFSPVAIDLLQTQERFRMAREEGRAHAHVWDISKPLTSNEPWLGVANVTTSLFCLSALHPNDFKVAAINIAATLKEGGTLVFRDYGRYDEAQLRLGSSRGKRLSEHFYRKHDGTTVYYFTVEDLRDLFVTHAGLEEVELDYIRRVYYNRGTGERRRRVWVQARFRKPKG